MGKSTTSILIVIVLVLIALGVVMLASTSVIKGEKDKGDPNYFLKRQAIWLTLGLVAAFVTSRVDYRYWQKGAVPFALFSVALLVMTLIPGVGVTINGSTRWLQLARFRLQPSELGKLASIVILSWWMARSQRQAAGLWRGLCIPLAMLGAFAVLILVEPDFGTAMLIGLVGMSIMFVGGTRIGYLLVTGLAAAGALGLMIAQDAERRGRILAFLNPQKYSEGEGYQLLQALYAFVVGGARGEGLGQSMQKRHYLPEAHTDFIFAIVGEELGFAVTLMVVILFALLCLCGLNISRRADDRFGKLLSFGIVTVITVQAAINIGVVTGSLPTKGIALPFISYGGSSLVVSLLMMGILVNVSRQSSDACGDADRRFIKDRAHHL